MRCWSLPPLWPWVGSIVEAGKSQARRAANIYPWFRHEDDLLQVKGDEQTTHTVSPSPRRVQPPAALHLSTRGVRLRKPPPQARARRTSPPLSTPPQIPPVPSQAPLPTAPSTRLGSSSGTCVLLRRMIAVPLTWRLAPICAPPHGNLCRRGARIPIDSSLLANRFLHSLSLFPHSHLILFSPTFFFALVNWV